ncbi:MAG: isoprenylcysteine carboxylmethyltransferase family protein [Desulfobacteraceae bacterium]|nr:MAG: isoprenylcysteine carboxylmethyltransferase family protein [Desulfobacteraceae bacterium]
MLLDLRNVIGGALAFIGFLGFCVGAAQVYYHKLTRRNAVTGGIYKFIRHPQYAALILCGLGMLLLWPRYIHLLSFIAMVFVYYFLAAYEETECERKYGNPYAAYKAKTSMFLPFHVSFRPKRSFLPKSGLARYLAILSLYGITAMTAVVAANHLKSWSLNCLYALYTKDAAYISVSRTDTETLEQIARIALENPDVRKRMEQARPAAGGKFINYILPAQWYVSEIPMKPTAGAVGGHHHPKDYDRNLIRIVFTKAKLRSDEETSGKDIPLRAAGTEPLLEIIVDLSQNKAIIVQDPPARKKYAGIPVPLY